MIMNEVEIYVKLDELIKNIKPDLNEVKPDQRLRRDLLLDSMEVMSFFYEIEDEFKIEIKLSDLDDLKALDFQSISKMVIQKINKGI
jgi:acyl carrier protein